MPYDPNSYKAPAWMDYNNVAKYFGFQAQPSNESLPYAPKNANMSMVGYQDYPMSMNTPLAQNTSLISKPATSNLSSSVATGGGGGGSWGGTTAVPNLSHPPVNTQVQNQTQVNPMLTSVGGNAMTANSPEVQAYMAKYPGTSIDVAIGSLQGRPTVSAAAIPAPSAIVNPNLNAIPNVTPWNQLSPEQQMRQLALGYSQGAGMYTPPTSTATSAITGNALTQMQREAAAGGLNVGGNVDLSYFNQTGGVPAGNDTQSQIQAIIQKMQSSQGNIQGNLDASIANIEAKYARQAQDIKSSVESQKQSEFSNLAGIGVNPLSSGGASVATAKTLLLDKMLSNNDQAKNVEIAQARAAAQGQETSGMGNILAALQNERQATQSAETTRYEQRRNSINDALTQLNTILAMQRENRAISKDDQATAQSQINNLFEQLGSQAFVSASVDQIRDLEKAAGVPYGTISARQQKSRSSELKGNAGELKEVGGSLYSVNYDPLTGVYKPTLVIQKAEDAKKGGGGSIPGIGAGAGIGAGGVADPSTLPPLYQQLMQNPKLLKNFTPTQASAILTNLANAGFDTGVFVEQIEMTPAIKSDIGNMDTLISQIDKISTADGSIPGVGWFQGRLPGVAITDEGKDARYTLNNILANIAKLRGGTSFTENEQKLLESYAPKSTDADSVIVGKLRNLKGFVEDSKNNIQKQFPVAGQASAEALREKYNY